MPALLTHADQVRELVANLERCYLTHRETNLHFALLIDLADADHEHLAEDDHLLELAQRLITGVRQRHGSAQWSELLLLWRPRRWNPSQSKWMGWERKRGKLEEFTRLLRDGLHSDVVQLVGDLKGLGHVRFVITVDEDTHIPPRVARNLVATLAHPLNRPVFDPERRRVTHGHGVIQPLMRATPASADASLFARLSTLANGMHPSAPWTSDLDQDLFGEGKYFGKAIYDVDAFLCAVAGRVPENHLLSHDLFEGALLRAATASDLELHEEFPRAYRAFARRLHRWTRGDWQLIPWLAPWAGVAGSAEPRPVRAGAVGPDRPDPQLTGRTCHAGDALPGLELPVAAGRRLDGSWTDAPRGADCRVRGGCAYRVGLSTATCGSARGPIDHQYGAVAIRGWRQERRHRSNARAAHRHAAQPARVDDGQSGVARRTPGVALGLAVRLPRPGDRSGRPGTGRPAPTHGTWAGAAICVSLARVTPDRRATERPAPDCLSQRGGRSGRGGDLARQFVRGCEAVVHGEHTAITAQHHRGGHR